MPNDNFTQQALANDPTFRQRLKASLARVAFVVLAEVGNPDHAARKAYALQVINNPDTVVQTLAGVIVFQNAVFSQLTTLAFDGRGGIVCQSPVTDAALDTLLSNAWNILSGV